MEKEFIPYQQSLDMKKLEFDEPCFGWYAHNGVYTGYSIKNSTIEELNMIKNSCSAPTYSQAFRWFREKHNLHGIVSYCGKNQWDIELLDYKGNQLVEIENNTFWTYEEAELECLKKLIEIVKTK